MQIDDALDMTEDEGVAKGEAAQSVLLNEKTRSRLINECLEVRHFHSGIAYSRKKIIHTIYGRPNQNR